MHRANCNCPQCRAGGPHFGFETFGPGESKEVFSEQEELELALELLHVQNEQELEQFLGNLFKSVGRGLSAVGSFARQNVLPVLGPILKQIAKTALPLAGGALGSFIPIPGVGTALGSALGGMVANALEMEVAGLNPGDADIERARGFIRVAASAIRDAASPLGSGPPEALARTALVNATMKHLPIAAGAFGAAASQRGAMPLAMPSRTAAGQSGTWRRHGRHIVVEGL